MEYTLCCYENGFELIDEVNNLIAKGWIPQGGMCFHPGNDDFKPAYCQAMIRMEKKDDKAKDTGSKSFFCQA